ncbi:hypothetical protein BpHYR1_023938 [Brachionus plicatilis]|uniref:Uncharacterized protein n=1 Tax=Brachionus plicatilis TaxID=10195 RepID=A0A3M7R1C8_BRAPC|nr:hypothetical protein BpHYR1_023938 [Brachionus plicatilis]
MIKSQISYLIECLILDTHNSICSNLVGLVLPLQQSKIPKSLFYLKLGTRIVSVLSRKRKFTKPTRKTFDN